MRDRCSSKEENYSNLITIISLVFLVLCLIFGLLFYFTGKEKGYDKGYQEGYKDRFMEIAVATHDCKPLTLTLEMRVKGFENRVYQTSIINNNCRWVNEP